MEMIIQEKIKNFERIWRIKRVLAEKRETISSLSRKLDRPVCSVTNNIYGYRANLRLQGEIAAFLGHPVKELFEEMRYYSERLIG